MDYETGKKLEEIFAELNNINTILVEKFPDLKKTEEKEVYKPSK